MTQEYPKLKNVSFNVFVPHYIPEGFELGNVEVLNEFEEQEIVAFEYIWSEEDSKKGIIFTRESYPAGNYVTTVDIQKDDNTKAKNIKIDGMDGILIKGEDSLQLMWNNNDIVCSMHANVSKKELIKIVKDMK